MMWMIKTGFCFILVQAEMGAVFWLANRYDRDYWNKIHFNWKAACVISTLLIVLSFSLRDMPWLLLPTGLILWCAYLDLKTMQVYSFLVWQILVYALLFFICRHHQVVEVILIGLPFFLLEKLGCYGGADSRVLFSMLLILKMCGSDLWSCVVYFLCVQIIFCIFYIVRYNTQRKEKQFQNKKAPLLPAAAAVFCSYFLISLF